MASRSGMGAGKAAARKSTKEASPAPLAPTPAAGPGTGFRTTEGGTAAGAREGAKASAELGGVKTPEEGAASLPLRTRMTGPESATGQALRDASGEAKIPQGEARGSTRPIEGGVPKPDLDIKVTAEARGAQLEPAHFVSNGSVEHGTVGSPSGPVPVAAVTADPDEARRRLEAVAEERARHNQRFATRRRVFTPEEVSNMRRTDLLAIAEQYGYDVGGDRGTRVTRTAFLKAQEDYDGPLEDEERD